MSEYGCHVKPAPGLAGRLSVPMRRREDQEWNRAFQVAWDAFQDLTRDQSAYWAWRDSIEKVLLPELAAVALRRGIK